MRLLGRGGELAGLRVVGRSLGAVLTTWAELALDKLTVLDGRPMTKEPESQVRIRFQDCDPFGHLNNSQYIDYFLNAREDQLFQTYGLNVTEWWQQHHAAWVVTRHQITYHLPAAVGEIVTIRTAVLRFSDRDILLESTMHDLAKRRLKALVWTEFRYVDTQSGRPINHPEELMATFVPLCLEPDIALAGYEARFQSLKRRGTLTASSDDPPTAS